MKKFFSKIGIVPFLLLGWLLIFYFFLPSKPELGSKQSSYPNPSLTPGKLGTIPITRICAEGTKKFRNVPESERREVAKRYGIPYPPAPGTVEFDHWYSLGISGSNDIENIWPMKAPEFRKKDVVETYLNREVCAGRMKVSEAVTITRNWTAFYQKNFISSLGAETFLSTDEPVD